MKSKFLHEGGPYHIETSLLTCRINHWTAYYTIYNRDLGHERVEALLIVYIHRGKIIDIYTSKYPRRML